jgi:hypothetical protein
MSKWKLQVSVMLGVLQVDRVVLPGSFIVRVERKPFQQQGAAGLSISPFILCQQPPATSELMLMTALVALPRQIRAQIQAIS